MQQHLGRQAGVAKVETNLLDGSVVITPKEDGRLDPARILKATYDSGVSVAAMDVVATGRVVAKPEGLVFEVEPNLSFPVVANAKADELKGQAGKEVTLRGRLYQKPAGKGDKEPSAALKLEVLEILRK